MATETAGCPRGVTDLAIHCGVIMRETNAPVVAGIVDPGFRLAAFPPSGITDADYSPPGFSVALQRFRVSGLGIVVRRQRINRVDRLRNFPANVGRHGGLLPKFGSFPSEPWTEWRIARVKQ